MSEIDYNRILKETLRKISNNSVLEESEALKIISVAAIPALWLDFLSDRIIEMANKRESTWTITKDILSLMEQIIAYGGVENYKIIKGFLIIEN